MKLVAIAACNLSGVIGNEGKLPWHIPDDLKRFKALTEGCKVIMGRKTYKSLGKPLPGRENIVLTRKHNTESLSRNGVTVIDGVTALHFYLSENTTEDEVVYVIGGSEIYTQLLPYCEAVELTLVINHAMGDAYFPKVNLIDWEIASSETHVQEKTALLNYYTYRYITYRRVNHSSVI